MHSGGKNLGESVWNLTDLFVNFCIRFIAKFKVIEPMMSDICLNVHQWRTSKATKHVKKHCLLTQKDACILLIEKKKGS